VYVYPFRRLCRILISSQAEFEPLIFSWVAHTPPYFKPSDVPSLVCLLTEGLELVYCSAHQWEIINIENPIRFTPDTIVELQIRPAGTRTRVTNTSAIPGPAAQLRTCIHLTHGESYSKTFS
jgi:hypothetical protein